MTQAMRRLPEVKRFILPVEDAKRLPVTAAQHVELHLTKALKWRPRAVRVEVVVKVFRGES